MIPMKCLCSALALLLAVEIAVPAGWAESAGKLNLVVIEGDSAINDIHQKAARQAAVRVEDEAGKPVSGAVVAFSLPAQGPTANFAGGTKTLATMTDKDGVAVARLLEPTGAGTMAIRVNASHEGRTGAAQISQVNMMVPTARKGSGKWVALALILGGVAAGGAVALAHGKNTPAAAPAPASIGLTPGTTTIGPPQ